MVQFQTLNTFHNAWLRLQAEFRNFMMQEGRACTGPYLRLHESVCAKCQRKGCSLPFIRLEFYAEVCVQYHLSRNAFSWDYRNVVFKQAPADKVHQLEQAIRRRILIRIIYNLGNSFGKFYVVKQQFAVKFAWLASAIFSKNGIGTHHRLLFHLKKCLYFDLLLILCKHAHLNILLMYRSCFSI